MEAVTTDAGTAEGDSTIRATPVTVWSPIPTEWYEAYRVKENLRGAESYRVVEGVRSMGGQNPQIGEDALGVRTQGSGSQGQQSSRWRPRWKITIVIPFSPGEIITTPTLSKGKNITRM